MTKSMKTRIVLGLAMIAAVAGLLWLDYWLPEALARWAGQPSCPARATGAQPLKGLPLAVAFLAILVAAFRELVRLAAGSQVVVLAFSGLFGAACLGSLPFWWQFVEPLRGPGGMDVLAVLAVLAMLVFAEQMARGRTQDALRRIAVTFLAMIYLGAGGAIILGLRMAYGVPMLVLFLAAVKFTDIGAYFTGSAIGRHKMIPWLSPGKSWEGLAGGLALAAGVSVLGAWLLGVNTLPPPKAALFGVAVGLAGQFGDLCESLLKRSANAKDSGAVVPEFGGVLDIIDSPLLAGPVAYLLLVLLA